MDEIRILNDRKIKKSTRILTIIVTPILVLFALILGSIAGMIIAVVVGSTLLLNKYTIINNEGVIVNYDIKFYTYQEKLLFINIDTIIKEEVLDPKLIVLHIDKGSTTKRCLLTVEDATRVLEMAMSTNPKIIIKQM